MKARSDVWIEVDKETGEAYEVQPVAKNIYNTSSYHNKALMDIYLKNTSSGLIPMIDDDYESKQKLKIGEVYKCTIKKARNYELLKKYFALINCSWEYLREPQQQFFQQ